MSILPVVPIVVVVLFWLIAFVFAWWFTARALRAPIEYEAEHAVSAHDANPHTGAAH
jgi:phosphotransferase system  glucose/maltose/N-acetylglucosamine-specific IIC component